MADNTTNIDLTKARGAADKWKEANNSFQVNCSGAFTKSLSALTTGEAVGAGYINMVEKKYLWVIIYCYMKVNF